MRVMELRGREKSACDVSVLVLHFKVLVTYLEMNGLSDTAASLEFTLKQVCNTQRCTNYLSCLLFLALQGTDIQKAHLPSD